MERKPDGKDPQTTRDDRLKAALRANLQRRKAQARARADGAADGPGRVNEQQQDDG